jgi:PAS domain S-box-containing protein
MTLPPSLMAQILASAPDAIITLDDADVITSWNRAAEAIYGWTSVEALGRPVSELVPTSYFPPETADSVRARVRRQGWWLGHVRQIRRDGAPLHIYSAISLLRDAADQPQGLVAVNRDVTDHAYRDQSSPAELDQPIAPGSSDGIWDWNITNGVMTFSARMHELLERPPEQQFVLNHTILQAVHPDDYDLAAQALSAHLERHEPFSIELRLRTGAGAYRWFLARGQACWDSRGRPIQMTGSLTDIDEIRRARQALEDLNRTLEVRVAERTAELKQSLHLVESITTALPDLLYIYNLERRRFVYANRSLLAMLGYSGAEADALRGQMLVKLIHVDDAEKIEAHMSRVAALADGAIAEFEYRLRDATGTWRWLYGRELVFQRDEHGQAALILGVGSDVTGRRQTDEALRRINDELSAANAQLARVNRLKDEFLANMSHELRTPLNAILGRAESLLEHIHGPLNQPQIHAITSIEESGRHLLDLINDILDLSKIEADRLYLDLVPVSGLELCEACLRLVGPAAHKQGLTLRLNVSGPVPPIVTDARRLKQILLNLLANAIKFTPSGGHVQLEVAWLTTQAQVAFTVCDTGIGIAEADMGLLFQPFVQIDSGLQRHFAGTGLGLALVARLADRLGGSVGVSSRPGQGSCFSLYLAVAEDEQAPAAPPRADRVTTGTGPRLLLAEDRSRHIARTAAALADVGYQVRVVHDGDECLRTALATHPDLMVVDLQLPRLSGLDLIRRLRAAPSLTTTPLIALTALDRPGDEDRYHAAGASRYLRKPLTPQRLYQLISELC